MLQFHDNMPPVQRIIATRVKHKCICSEKLEAFIAADTAVASAKYVRVRLISKKMDQHTGGKWLIHSATKTINREAWNTPWKYAMWEHKSDKR